MTISKDKEKTFNQVHTYLMDAKSLAETRIRRNMIKAIDDRSIANPMEKNSNHFLQKSEIGQVCPLSQFLFSLVHMIPAKQ